MTAKATRGTRADEAGYNAPVDPAPRVQVASQKSRWVVVGRAAPWVGGRKRDAGIGGWSDARIYLQTILPTGSSKTRCARRKEP